MYKQKITIAICPNSDSAQLYEDFNILLNSFRRAGQIVGSVQSAYVAVDEIICYQTTLEQNSLDAQNNDEWVDLAIKNLEQRCNSKIKIEVVGQSVPFNRDVCGCKQPDSYVLFTTYANESSPVDCGTCGSAVPVYNIKGLTHEDRSDIESWERDYVSCDHLNMGSNAGEKWAAKQMSDPKSQLSKFGRGICDRISQVTGMPSYYFLFNYRAISISKDKLRKCPSCNGQWLLNKKWLGFYDFKCESCKLVSTLTSKS